MASELIRRQAGSVCVLEAGPSERHPLVSMPFGLVWLMGSTRIGGLKPFHNEMQATAKSAFPAGKWLVDQAPSIQWFGFADIWQISTVGILMVGGADATRL